MIQIYVSMLRKVLPEGVLVTRSPGYAVELPREAIDLVRFEDLRQAGQAALAAGSPAARPRAAPRGAGAVARPGARRVRGAVRDDRVEAARGGCISPSIEDRIEAELALGRHGAWSASCTRSWPAIRCASGSAAS